LAKATVADIAPSAVDVRHIASGCDAPAFTRSGAAKLAKVIAGATAASAAAAAGNLKSALKVSLAPAANAAQGRALALKMGLRARLGLRYASRNESPTQRAMQRADRIVIASGGSRSIISNVLAKSLGSLTASGCTVTAIDLAAAAEAS